MCGIAGCTGGLSAGAVVIASLKRLEYRGYDSAGITLGGSPLRTVKISGKVCSLERSLGPDDCLATWAIAHTRWATCGAPTAENAHPHLSGDGRISVVHNGIIENFAELREELTGSGHVFLSETDSEVIPHLIEEYYDGDPLRSTASALRRLSGAFGVAAVFERHPETIICASVGSPVVIGLDDGRTFVASDVQALAPYTRRVIRLKDGEIARLTPCGAEIFSLADLRPIRPEISDLPVETSVADKGGFEHFMLKEIMEQPECCSNALKGRLDFDRGTAVLPGLGLSPRELARVSRILIAGCGSSIHAGLAGAYCIEGLAGIPVSVEQASEFRYRNPVLEPETLVIALSQSGETADTVAAVREARSKGAWVTAVCNVEASTIAREADSVIPLRAGPELSVAATKTFTSQLVVLYLLALLAGRNRRLPFETASRLLREAEELPCLIREVLDEAPAIKALAEKYVRAEDMFYIGRGNLYPVALEGALKLKEISYVHAEGYHAAELKHGPIALLDELVPVVALVNPEDEGEKVCGNIRECLARKAPVIAVVAGKDMPDALPVRDIIRVPACSRFLLPAVAAVALQLFAYFFARSRGCSVDQPRNLAKSVTVE
ncbi:MAG: glutamine--fructose-6-phosphate transaminase (isomerizing) [Lentisphaeria bacterium]|nr:glutamine--fructose-6-phosphate transaminase (isomerizing) [Lentisphaeria bacterium]